MTLRGRTLIVLGALGCGVFTWACAHDAESAAKPVKSPLEDHVFARSTDDVWDLAKQMLEDAHYTVQPSTGTYRMEATSRPHRTYPDGGSADFDAQGYREKTGEWTNAPRGYGSGVQRSGGAQRRSSSTHLIIAGEAVDDTHAKVNIYRVVPGEDAPEFAEDWEKRLIRRVEEGPPDAGR